MLSHENTLQKPENKNGVHIHTHKHFSDGNHTHVEFKIIKDIEHRHKLKGERNPQEM